LSAPGETDPVQPPNKGLRDPGDDPLLPFVLAAKAGDRGAERELLLRVAPVVLAVVRVARPGNESTLSAITLETLIATLRALPTLRGEEAVRDVVAKIALEKLRGSVGALGASDERILAAAHAHARRSGRVGDAARIEACVERALEDDAAVLVSHVMMRTRIRSKSRAHIWLTLGALALGAALAFFGLR
jgi:hypothetical protein